MPASKVTEHGDIVSSEEEAVELGCTLVLDSVKNQNKVHGSSIGDLVGFRLELTNEAPKSIYHPKQINWKDVKHLFFKRGSSYFLYKTWSWPD